MKKIKYLPIGVLVIIILFFFHSFILQGKLPIPSDTIVGLYHPFRDVYAKTYPNGIPYKNYLITDPVRQQYPWRWLAVSLEKEGLVPLWNPYSFGGTPLLANFQTAAFYPLNLLLFILPFSYGWSLLILLQPILSGLFLYWYLSNLRLNYFARFLGSVVYSFCGYMTAWLEWGTMDQIVIWLPLILLTIDKMSLQFAFSKISLASARVYVWPVIFVVSLASAFLAGHLQPFGYVLFVTICYFIARWMQFGRSLRVLLLFFCLLVAFVIVTTMQWIPTVEFLLQSARNADQLDAWKQPGWFIPWQHLIQFVAPDFFGNPATLNYWGVWNYGELVGYIGIFPLIMALFALFFRRDKKTFFFGIFFFLSLIFSLQNIFAKLPYLLQIPFLDSSQPTRLIFITDFSLSVLSALGLDFYLKSKKKKQIIFPVLFIFLSFLGLWIFVIFGKKLVPIDSLAIAKHNLYFPTLLFVISMIGVVCTIFIKKNKVTTSIIIVLLLLSVVDLFRFSDKFTPFTNKAYLFPPTATLNYLQRQPGQFRILATDSEILPPNFSVMYHLQSLSGYDPLYLQRYGELLAAISRNKPDIHAPFGFNRIITPTNIQSRLIDLFGVQYILSLSDLQDTKLTKIYTEGQTRLYKNANAFPRVFFVNTIKPVSDKENAIQFLFDQAINLHKTAIVEGWDQSLTTFGNASATITDYQANSITIAVNSDQQSFLVLTDTFYPTWHVRVDGKEARIYRTDYNFRGVIIPKGSHIVVFSDSLL